MAAVLLKFDEAFSHFNKCTPRAQIAVLVLIVALPHLRCFPDISPSGRRQRTATLRQKQLAVTTGVLAEGGAPSGRLFVQPSSPGAALPLHM